MQNHLKEKTSYRIAVGVGCDLLDHSAPHVAIKGERAMAAELVLLAQRFSVPVWEDSELACALSCVDVDCEIPERLFEVVAIVLNQIKTDNPSW